MSMQLLEKMSQKLFYMVKRKLKIFYVYNERMI